MRKERGRVVRVGVGVGDGGGGGGGGGGRRRLNACCHDEGSKLFDNCIQLVELGCKPHLNLLLLLMMMLLLMLLLLLSALIVTVTVVITELRQASRRRT